MDVRDMGHLDGEVLVFGGVYSNLSALDAFLSSPARNADHLLCSGDVVAYCARGEACVQRLRALGCPVLAGNCEVQIADGAEDCGCGYADGSVCSVLSRGWYAHALATISAPSRQWMAGLPDRITFEHAGKRWVMVHGGASDIAAFVWPVSTDDEIRAEIALVQEQVGPVDGVIAGHTGLVLTREIDGVTWFNPGGLGMPANHGRPDVSYGVLTADGPRVDRLIYDPAPEVAAMRKAGLTQGYERTLETGWWPSEDTLPPEMRRQSV